MKKIFKTCILLFLILLLSSTYVHAFNINMNLEDYTPSNTQNAVQENSIENDLSENETLNNDIDNAESDETNNSSPKLTTVKNSDDSEFLTFENVLSIIIIVIGILLIFLAVAILIRLR